VKQFIRIGLDLGKNYFQVHGLESENGAAMTRKLSRAKVLGFFAGLAPCRVGMEACGSAHYWARELAALGHAPVLIAPAYVKPYVKRCKSDAADAAAICEAMSRPGMRFVPVKSADQQAILMLHKTRELLIMQRTMSVNALRGHMAEFGLVVAKGIAHVDELRALAHEDARLPPAAKAALSQIGRHLDEIGAALKAIEDEIAKEHAQNQMSQLIDEIPAFGPLISSAIAASVADPKVFRSGSDFAAWLGLTPRQDSTGGKTTLGPITKKGNPYLRKMLVVGARSVLHVAHKRKGALAEWIMKMRANKKERVAVVALANKLARICWAVMSSGECFRSEIYARA
jgi:transposase